MWIERTYFSTAYKLPGILRWFEVTSYSTVSDCVFDEAVMRSKKVLVLQQPAPNFENRKTIFTVQQKCMYNFEAATLFKILKLGFWIVGISKIRRSAC